jgi:CHAD domain-containing protein
MSFHLKRRERIARGIRRVADGQLEGIRRALRRARRQEYVREVRKRTKKLRALLRLVRSDLGSAVFGRENAAFRDISRHLASLRDADVLVEVVSTLDPETPRTKRFALVLRRLRRHRQRVRQEFFSDAARVQSLRDAVAKAASRLKDWTPRRINAGTLTDGVRRSYRRAIETFAGAHRSTDDARWHEWRKRTKDLLYHLQLVERVWPPVIGAALPMYKELSRSLGAAQDLAIVRQRLAEVVPEADVAGERRRIVAILDRRRRKFHASARKSGQALLNEKPRAFAERFRACWEVWRRRG